MNSLYYLQNSSKKRLIESSIESKKMYRFLFEDTTEATPETSEKIIGDDELAAANRFDPHKEDEVSDAEEDAYTKTYKKMNNLSRATLPILKATANLMRKASRNLQRTAGLDSNEEDIVEMHKLANQFFASFNSLLKNIHKYFTIEARKGPGSDIEFNLDEELGKNPKVVKELERIISNSFKAPPGFMKIFGAAMLNMKSRGKKDYTWKDFLSELIAVNLTAKQTDKELRDLFGGSFANAILKDLKEIKFGEFRTFYKQNKDLIERGATAATARTLLPRPAGDHRDSSTSAPSTTEVPAHVKTSLSEMGLTDEQIDAIVASVMSGGADEETLRYLGLRENKTYKIFSNSINECRLSLLIEADEAKEDAEADDAKVKAKAKKAIENALSAVAEKQKIDVKKLDIDKMIVKISSSKPKNTEKTIENAESDTKNKVSLKKLLGFNYATEKNRNKLLSAFKDGSAIEIKTVIPELDDEQDKKIKDAITKIIRDVVVENKMNKINDIIK